MSCPIGNTLVIKSTDEIFSEIASRLLDLESGLTTYEKICSVPEDIDESRVDEWFGTKYDAPKGVDGFVDAAKGLIDFTTNWRCAQNIIAELAPQYPQAKIEFNYTIYADEGVFFCCDTYENGVLIGRKQILDDYEDEDDEDEE